MNLAQDIAALPTLSVSQLRLRYAEIFGETTNAAHKGWLVKRIAWRIQALAEGNLSERARQRAAELANDADLLVLRVAPCRVDPGVGDMRLHLPLKEGLGTLRKRNAFGVALLGIRLRVAVPVTANGGRFVALGQR